MYIIKNALRCIARSKEWLWRWNGRLLRFDGSGANDYITEVNSAMNLTVVLQMIGVGLLLTLVASAASVLFIMRYDPLKILANRD